MKLQPGTMAYAVVKATNVVVELADAAVAAMVADGDAAERPATRRRTP
jgi:phosphoketolase